MVRWHKRKRLNLGVKRDFQRWLLVRLLGVVLLSAVVSGAILYFYARQETMASFYDAHIRLRRVSDLLLPVILAGTTVSLISGLLLALFLPQKIAGPVHRLEQDLVKVRSGSLRQRIHLRDEDCLQDVAQSINDTLSYVQQETEKLLLLQKQLDEGLLNPNPLTLQKIAMEQSQVLERLLGRAL